MAAVGNVLRVLLVIWLAYSGYLYLTGYLNTYGILGGAYLAARDSLYQLPDNLLMLAQLAVDMVGTLHDRLVSEVGHDPFELPEIAGGISSLSTPLDDHQIVGYLVYGGVVGSTVAGVQFLMLTALAVRNGDALWRHPGIPILSQLWANLLFKAGTIGAGLYLVPLAAETGTASAIAATLMVTFCFVFPVLAGLPLWFMTKVLVPPFSALFRTLAARAKPTIARERGRDRKHDRNTRSSDRHRNEEAHRWQRRDQERQQQRQSRDSGPTDRTGLNYPAACELFELSPGSFDQPTLIKRYRELMRKTHPDNQGSNALAKQVNQAYETILNHHNWKR